MSVVVCASSSSLQTPIVRPYAYRMRRVVRSAKGVFIDRQGWHVLVRTVDGFCGVGDVAPWPGFGSSAVLCQAALHQLPQILPAGLWPDAQAQGQMLAALPVEVAYGVSCALLDIEAQRAQRSLADFLAAPLPSAPSCAVHALVDNALEAQAAVAQGYRAIKIKIGTEALSDEVTRVVALRAAVGPNIGLRLDANGAWPVAVAVRAARLLALVSPEWLEQPVDKADVAGMAEVRRLGGVPIAADESVVGPSDVTNIIAQEAADVIVVKPMFAGGLREAMRLGEMA